MSELKNRVAPVTGGSRGIGKAVALALAASNGEGTGGHLLGPNVWEHRRWPAQRCGQSAGTAVRCIYARESGEKLVTRSMEGRKNAADTQIGTRERCLAARARAAVKIETDPGTKMTKKGVPK